MPLILIVRALLISARRVSCMILREVIYESWRASNARANLCPAHSVSLFLSLNSPSFSLFFFLLIFHFIFGKQLVVPIVPYDRSSCFSCAYRFRRDLTDTWIDIKIKWPARQNDYSRSIDMHAETTSFALRLLHRSAALLALFFFAYAAKNVSVRERARENFSSRSL